jgi:hypothetical protein
MIWSFYHSRMFRTCQRQWYLKTIMASATANHPLRREAFLLSKLQSIAAWRGSLVDAIISDRMIPVRKDKPNPNPARIIEDAREIFNKQLKFATQHRLRKPGMTLKEAGDAFAAFHAVEYELAVTQAEIKQAWTDVEQALTNLLQMRELWILLSQAVSLIPQRPLTFPYYQEIKVKAVPDLIAFFDNRPPLIVDWKVHTFGRQDARLQLATYALALTHCKPHIDFPRVLSRYHATDIRLLEVQLLTKQQREYTLSNDDIEEVENHIAQTAMEMVLATRNRSNGALSPFDFPTTAYPEHCQICPFRSLCWLTNPELSGKESI